MGIAEIIGTVLTLLKWPVSVCQQRMSQRRSQKIREELLHLLREGKWGPSPRAFTGTGRSLVYESELMSASPLLKKLGEYRLHQVLMELRAEGMINHSEFDRNRWFALY